MHGHPIAETARHKAGMTPEFIAALAAYVPEPRGRPIPDQPPDLTSSQS